MALASSRLGQLLQLGFAFAHGSIKPSLQQALVNLHYVHVG